MGLYRQVNQGSQEIPECMLVRPDSHQFAHDHVIKSLTYPGTTLQILQEPSLIDCSLTMAQPVNPTCPKLHQFQRILKQYCPDITPFVDLYKDIHQHPELSCFESRTARVVAQCLRQVGFEITTSISGHGVVGHLKNGGGKTILLRAELDSLL
jgi:hypothetical protein